MAITTIKGHVSRAIDFYNRTSYFALSKDTPWDNESNPPNPTSTDELEKVLGYKMIESRFLVVPSSDGEIVYANQRWKIIGYDNAYTSGARWVYISSYISYSELPTDISYRQVGVVTSLTTTNPEDRYAYALTPDKVSNPGMLEIIDNRKPVYREADMREQISMVIEF